MALSVAASLASGCHLFEPPAEKSQAGREVEVDPAEYAEQVDAKLRRFASCRQIVASIMSESWDRYSDQVSDDGKPRRRREGVYLRGIGSNAFRSCRRVLEAAKNPPPMARIEAEAQALVNAGMRYAELSRALETYLDADGWREDDWATLATLDPDIRGAHQAWLTADTALLQAIDVRHIENDPILLGVLEGRRSPLEVAARHLMIHARPLVRCMVGAGEGSEADADAPPDCSAKFQAFDEAVSAFGQAYERDRAAADKVFWMSTFAKDVEEFHALVSEMQRKFGQRKAKVSELQELGDDYASLVRDAETLDFDFP